MAGIQTRARTMWAGVFGIVCCLAMMAPGVHGDASQEFVNQCYLAEYGDGADEESFLLIPINKYPAEHPAPGLRNKPVADILSTPDTQNIYGIKYSEYPNLANKAFTNTEASKPGQGAQWFFWYDHAHASTGLRYPDQQNVYLIAAQKYENWDTTNVNNYVLGSISLREEYSTPGRNTGDPRIPNTYVSLLYSYDSPLVETERLYREFPELYPGYKYTVGQEGRPHFGASDGPDWDNGGEAFVNVRVTETGGTPIYAGDERIAGTAFRVYDDGRTNPVYFRGRQYERNDRTQQGAANLSDTYDENWIGCGESNLPSLQCGVRDGVEVRPASYGAQHRYSLFKTDGMVLGELPSVGVCYVLDQPEIPVPLGWTPLNRDKYPDGFTQPSGWGNANTQYADASGANPPTYPAGSRGSEIVASMPTRPPDAELNDNLFLRWWDNYSRANYWGSSDGRDNRNVRTYEWVLDFFADPTMSRRVAVAPNLQQTAFDGFSNPDGMAKGVVLVSKRSNVAGDSTADDIITTPIPERFRKTVKICAYNCADYCEQMKTEWDCMKDVDRGTGCAWCNDGDGSCFNFNAFGDDIGRADADTDDKAQAKCSINFNRFDDLVSKTLDVLDDFTDDLPNNITPVDPEAGQLSTPDVPYSSDELSIIEQFVAGTLGSEVAECTGSTWRNSAGFCILCSSLPVNCETSSPCVNGVVVNGVQQPGADATCTKCNSNYYGRTCENVCVSPVPNGCENVSCTTGSNWQCGVCSDPNYFDLPRCTPKSCKSDEYLKEQNGVVTCETCTDWGAACATTSLCGGSDGRQDTRCEACFTSYYPDQNQIDAQNPTLNSETPCGSFCTSNRYYDITDDCTGPGCKCKSCSEEPFCSAYTRGECRGTEDWKCLGCEGNYVWDALAEECTCPTNFFLTGTVCQACTVLSNCDTTFTTCGDTTDNVCAPDGCASGYKLVGNTCVLDTNECQDVNGTVPNMVFKQTLSEACCQSGNEPPPVEDCCVPGDPNYPCFDKSECTLDLCCEAADSNGCCDIYGQFVEPCCKTFGDDGISSNPFDFSAARGVCCSELNANTTPTLLEVTSSECPDEPVDPTETSTPAPPIARSECIVNSEGTAATSADGPCCFLGVEQDPQWTNVLEDCDISIGEVKEPNISEEVKLYDWVDPSNNIDTLYVVMIIMIVVFILILIAALGFLYWSYRRKKNAEAIDWNSVFQKEKNAEKSSLDETYTKSKILED